MKKLSGLIDFHSHILPGADHGSSSAETSAGQLKLLFDTGVSDVVATPHFYPNVDSVDSFLQRRNECEKALSRIQTVPDMNVYVGAEVLVCRGMQNMEGLERLCIRGTNVLLLEMPFSRWKEELFETVYEISLRKDLRVVMAHIGRYPTEYIDRLFYECDVTAQLNGENMTDRHNRKRVLKWLSDGIVSAFGSDIHGRDSRAAEHLAELYELSGDHISEILKRSGELINGADKVKFDID